ncbi:TetR family transcriptional regulator [Ilumatobacter fluminis]|uniref:TetR family transcriptional regulator n=1 Tax=Ilumatobacter fluminis TaxID=467091 RepID=A0A4V3EIT7_9ACTN|nr:TetR/AcrR family transcriptional regulator [Ilumatobacter fluminis]TDT15538.1 TetR family transcriptional regulator [Ilumatobacter fluminis]
MSPVDRPAAIRKALRDLVAERGFHGASMGAIAKAAGVAAGTAYVHYASKEELVYATYLEIKAALGSAALDGIDPTAPPADRWRHVMTRAYEFFAAEPERARFLTQLEESPFYAEAHDRLIAGGDPLVALAEADDLAPLVVELPWQAVYGLSLGVVVRLVAAGATLTSAELDRLIEATWRAITRPG